MRSVRQTDEQARQRSREYTIARKRKIRSQYSNCKAARKRLQQHGSIYFGMIPEDRQQHVARSEDYSTNGAEQASINRYRFYMNARRIGN